MLTGLLWLAFFWFVFGRVRRARWRRHRRLHQLHYMNAAGGGRGVLIEHGWRYGPLMPQDHTRVAMPQARVIEVESPFDALKRRYVADEITVEEYEAELDRLYRK
jgi:hypothetical protein